MEQEVWDRIIKDCQKLSDNKPEYIDLGNWDGRYAARFMSMHIEFNGIGADAHETFQLQRQGSVGFGFCKTARKPYDLMVCACLIAYSFHSSDTIKISSDGYREDWQEAYDFVTEVLGAEYAVKFELEGGINEYDIYYD